MGTFSEIQDRVKRRVIDLPDSVTTEVPLFINEAVRRLEERHNFKVMEAETAQLLTTEANHVLAVVPSDYKEARTKPYLVFEDGSTRRLILAASREAVLAALTLSDPDDEGEPQVLLDAEPSDDDNTRNFEVYPFPDGASDFTGGEYRIVVPYWKFLATLSAGTDTNWFTSNAEGYLVNKASAEAFALDWDEERSVFWETKAAGDFQATLNLDKRSRLGAVDTFVPHKDVFDSKLET